MNIYEFTVRINLRHCSRIINNCATLKSKYYRRDNVIQKEAKPSMPATAYSYCCYMTCIIGFQFVTQSSTRYRILYRHSALKVFIAGVSHLLCVFYLSGQLNVFYIVEFLQISWPIIHNVNNGFLTVVINCYFCLRS